MEDLINQIKINGFSTITVEESFDDGTYCQISFRDNINSIHTAFFKNRQLLLIS